MGSEGRLKPEEELYTKNGTTDYKNSPANNAKTGTWKAFPYILGVTLLTLSAFVPGLRPTCDACESHPSAMQSTVTFIALYAIAHGTGRIKPCVSSFGADQFDDTGEGEKTHRSSFFNWFYFSINIGALVAAFGFVYIQTHVG